MFGIGDSSDLPFLKNSAIAGKGMAYTTSNKNLTDLRGLVADAIKRASQPCLRNCVIQFQEGQSIHDTKTV